MVEMPQMPTSQAGLRDGDDVGVPGDSEICVLPRVAWWVLVFVEERFHGSPVNPEHLWQPSSFFPPKNTLWSNTDMSKMTVDHEYFP